MILLTSGMYSGGFFCPIMRPPLGSFPQNLTLLISQYFPNYSEVMIVILNPPLHPPVMSLLRILIVDENRDSRESLRRLLRFQRNVKVVGEAEDRTGAITLAFSLHPEIVMMPFSMSGQDDVNTAREIKKELPEITVVLITDERPVRQRVLAKSVGIDALIPKYSLGKALPKLFNEVRFRIKKTGPDRILT